jgi:hypothetical protein
MEIREVYIFPGAEYRDLIYTMWNHRRQHTTDHASELSTHRNESVV